jgi:hypothetical protein
VLLMVRRHPFLLAYFAALVPAVLMAVTQPVWSLVDEAQHFDFIVQLSHGIYPAADTTAIDPTTLDVSKTTGVFRAFYPKGSYPVPDLSDVGAIPSGMTASADATWMARHVWQLSHESVQTPGYYLLMVPVWWAVDALSGPYGAIYAMRLINALLLASLAPMAVAAARLLAPARAEVAVVAALFAILLPGLDLNGTRVSNDAAAAALGGLAVLLAMRSAGRAWTWRFAAAMGLLMGAALMVKLTVGGVLLVLVVSALWPAPGTTWSGRLARTLLMGAVAVICLAPWFLVNLHIYGGPVPGARVARLADSLPGPLTAPFVTLDAAVFALTYWTGEPWGALPLAAPFAVLAGLLALMAPAGVVKNLRTAATREIRAALVIAVVAVIAMAGTALLLPATAGYEFVGPGRYAYPALPAIAAVLALGVCAVLRGGARQLAVGAYATVAVVMLVASAAGLPAPPAIGARTPPADATILTVHGSGSQDRVTITIDRVALDRRAKAIWLEVSVNNGGLDEAEWSAVPVVSNGGVDVSGDYRMSTQLPGDVDPGQTVSGWLWVPLDPATLNPGTPIGVRFLSVAVNGYSSVSDVEVAISQAS